MILTAAYAAQVYDLLVSIGGASPSQRDSFIYHHSGVGCGEWRFCGLLAFGGKYYSEANRVDCYREDLTPKRETIITELNAALAALPTE